MQQRLALLNPQRVEIMDDSKQHAGHEGAKSGGHFSLVIVAPAFLGKTMLARHRMVYDSLGDLMRTTIHALTINAISPDEERHCVLNSRRI